MADPLLVTLTLRALNGEAGAVHVWFDQAVLDRYREQASSRVVRTNSAGRLRAGDGWSVDFGIAEDERHIHAPLTDLAQRLPAPERSHWAQHVVTPPASRAFVTMRLHPGSCIDDGELRDWDKSGTE
jgi:hypothetical protein